MHAALRRCCATGVSSKPPSSLCLLPLSPPLLQTSSSSFRKQRANMATTAATSTSIASAPKHMPSDPYPHGLKSLGGATLEQVLSSRLGGSLAVGPLPASGSAFIKPASVSYGLDGKTRRWDVIEAHPSVGVILYHDDLDAFVVVRQFRPAVYASLLAAADASSPPPLHAAFTVELCAGLCDKDGKPPQEIAAEEVLEECGFVVQPSAIQPVTSAVSSAGTAGAAHHLFFARVSESMRAVSHEGGHGNGGGLADTGEAIEVLALPFERVDALVLDGARLSMSPGLQFGLTWAARELERGRLGGRGRGAGGGEKEDGDGLLTAELRLKPVLPA